MVFYAIEEKEIKKTKVTLCPTKTGLIFVRAGAGRPASAKKPLALVAR